MRRTAILVALLIVGLSASAFAQKKERTFGQIYTDCGLGGMIGSAVEGTTGNVLAVITNITWDLGTTASSSNISSPDTCANNKEKTAMYIYESYDSIAVDLAKGGGKYVSSLLQVSGCQDGIQNSATTDLRGNLASLVSGQGYSDSSRYEKAEKFYETYVSTLNGKYSGKCSLS